ncbi:uncharacterized protein LOC102804437, partial [Saccoglossus kowalevskii]|uniref:Uncharacterized protein LOC102804437 n=1 Tax=Saccoglossus kowalevskii TaxID=10224 RepID=A0ABM0M1P2_SACKO
MKNYCNRWKCTVFTLFVPLTLVGWIGYAGIYSSALSHQWTSLVVGAGMSWIQTSETTTSTTRLQIVTHTNISANGSEVIGERSESSKNTTATTRLQIATHTNMSANGTEVIGRSKL